MEPLAGAGAGTSPFFGNKELLALEDDSAAPGYTETIRNVLIRAIRLLRV